MPLATVIWSLSSCLLRSLKLVLILISLWVFQNISTINSIKSGSLFHLICLTLLITVVSFFLTGKTIIFYILFELRLIPTLFMVFFFGYQPEKIQASMYLLIYAVISSLPLLLLLLNSCLYLNYFTGGNRFWFCVILTLAFIVKTPMYMVHVWLPKAHVEAPVAGSIVLAGVLLKLGSYGLLIFCPRTKRMILLLYLSLRIVGSLYCRIICIRQWDLKRLIAYSSVVHMGVVTVGVVRGMEMGYFCAIIIVVAHGVCSPIIFSLAFLVYNSSHTRLISRNKGTLATPIISFFLFTILAINIGVPPRLNLWSEVIIFVSLLGVISYSSFFLLVMAFLGVIYNLFMYISLSQSKESDYIKIDYVYWPLISSCYLSFFIFFMLRWFRI